VADLLIALYGRDGLFRWEDAPSPAGVLVRRALAHERVPVQEWVDRSFGTAWAGEVALALGTQPTTCFLAVRGAECVGFCCYDTAYRGFLGPLGVAAGDRRGGIGRALVHATLRALWHAGYAYAVVGASGATAFYRRVAGAWAIPGSEQGPYPPRLGRNPSVAEATVPVCGEDPR